MAGPMAEGSSSVFSISIASKLEVRTAEEVTQKNLAMAGVDSILKGENSLVIQSKLEAYLDPGHRGEGEEGK